MCIHLINVELFIIFSKGFMTNGPPFIFFCVYKYIYKIVTALQPVVPFYAISYFSFAIQQKTEETRLYLILLRKFCLFF